MSSVLVSQPTLLVCATTTSAVKCNGAHTGLITATATGGQMPYAYSWSPVASQAGSLSGLAAGSYTVFITDANGCTNSVASVVQEPAKLSSTASNFALVCYGNKNGLAAALVNGGVSPYQFSWSTVPLQQTDTAHALGAGTYTVHVTDNNGCTSSSVSIVSQPAKLTATIPYSSAPLCYGATNGTANSAGSGGTAPYHYSWNTNPAQQNQVVSNLAAGTYSVTVTDKNGCVSSGSVVLNQPPALLISTTQDNVNCHGASTGSVSTSLQGGSLPYQYSWNNGSAATSLTGLSAGMYNLVVTDAHGCRVGEIVTITENALIQPVVQISNESCYGGKNGWASASVSGGVAPYQYNWNTSPPQTGSSVNGLPAGTYSLTVTDHLGCTTTSPVMVQQPPAILVTANGSSKICSGQAAGVYAQASGGNGTFQYSWNQGLGNGASHVVNPAQTTQYVVQVTDNAGCTAPPDTITIQVMTLQSSSIHPSPGDSICPGQHVPVSVSVSGNSSSLSYTWSNGLGSGPGPYLVSPTATTTYTVSVGNGCNQYAMALVTIRVNPFPLLGIVAENKSSCSRLTFNSTIQPPIQAPPTSGVSAMGHTPLCLLHHMSIHSQVYMP
jgi:hypothetical protein